MYSLRSSNKTSRFVFSFVYRTRIHLIGKVSFPKWPKGKYLNQTIRKVRAAGRNGTALPRRLLPKVYLCGSDPLILSKALSHPSTVSNMLVFGDEGRYSSFTITALTISDRLYVHTADESSVADTIISPSTHPTSRSPSRHAYLPGSLQLGMSSPASSVRQTDSLLCKSERNTGGVSGRQPVTTTKTSHPPWSTMTSPEEVSRHSHIHNSSHIRGENRPPNQQQHSLSDGPTGRSGSRGNACQRLGRKAWKVPKMIQSLVPQRSRNDDNSPLLNPDAIRGRRSLNMLELTVGRDDDCFRDDDGNDPKRYLNDDDAPAAAAAVAEDDMASDSALVGSPLSARLQRVQYVLSPSNAKHNRRFGDSPSMRPPLPYSSKRSNRFSF